VSLRDIVNVANSEVVFAVLFIVGLFAVGKYIRDAMQEQKEENKRREEQLIEIYKNELDKSANRERELMIHLDKNTEQLQGIADTLKDVQRGLTKLEDRVEDNFMAVWKELGAKADKSEVVKVKQYFSEHKE
jgi:ABC-type bacteriocin/lantibiotic exporter with double-glycine peptidase domain